MAQPIDPTFQTLLGLKPDTSRAMAELRNSGVDIVGLSSIGPTIYAISKDVDLLTENCQRIGADFLFTGINNAGMLESVIR